MEILLLFLGAAFGFTLCWFAKDNIIVMAAGADALLKKLEAKAAALKKD